MIVIDLQRVKTENLECKLRLDSEERARERLERLLVKARETQRALETDLIAAVRRKGVIDY